MSWTLCFPRFKVVQSAFQELLAVAKLSFQTATLLFTLGKLNPLLAEMLSLSNMCSVYKSLLTIPWHMWRTRQRNS